MKHTSSTCLAKLGRRSLTHAPAFALLTELVLRPQHFGDALNEGESIAFQIFLGTVLAVIFLEFRFVVEQLKLAGCADHVQVDHASCFGDRRLGKSARRAERRLLHRQPERAHAGRAIGEELPPRILLDRRGVKLVVERLSVHGLRFRLFGHEFVEVEQRGCEGNHGSILRQLGVQFTKYFEFGRRRRSRHRQHEPMRHLLVE